MLKPSNDKMNKRRNATEELNPRIVGSPAVLFVGAGASASLGFKTTTEFLEVVRNICESDIEFSRISENWSQRVSIEQQDIENLLDYLESFKVGDQDNQKDAERLDIALRRAIVQHYSDIDADKALKHYGWLLIFLKGYPEDLHPIPIFTTNYDWVFERGIGSYKSYIRLLDGFRPTRLGTFWDNSTFVRFKGSRLSWDIPFFKLHGSTSWYSQPDGRIIKTTHAELDPGQLKTMLIYPTLSKKKPVEIESYATCYRYLRGCLSLGCQLCVVIGFSFRDAEISKIFAESLDVNRRLKLIVVDPSPDKMRILMALSTNNNRVKFVSESFKHYGLDENKTLQEELLARMSSRSILMRDPRLRTPKERFAALAVLKGLPGL
jgi:hypothetical protein